MPLGAEQQKPPVLDFFWFTNPAAVPLLWLPLLVGDPAGAAPSRGKQAAGRLCMTRLTCRSGVAAGQPPAAAPAPPRAHAPRWPAMAAPPAALQHGRTRKTRDCAAQRHARCADGPQATSRDAGRFRKAALTGPAKRKSSGWLWLAPGSQGVPGRRLAQSWPHQPSWQLQKPLLHSPWPAGAAAARQMSASSNHQPPLPCSAAPPPDCMLCACQLGTAPPGLHRQGRRTAALVWAEGLARGVAGGPAVTILEIGPSSLCVCGLLRFAGGG